ncbi:hypothetical protein B0H13DRAFT_2268678 [Mycena leptocephala]|nr:hypothetical protein B0H13DRAFT_2268678 [Mycena leptocephala]
MDLRPKKHVPEVLPSKDRERLEPKAMKRNFVKKREVQKGEQIARNFLSPKRVSFDASPRDWERRVTEDEDIFTIDAITARHEVEILPSTARTRTPNAVRDSLSERLIARKGARPPMGKEESVSGARIGAGCAADICGVRLGARLETWGRDDEYDSRWCRDAPLVPRLRRLWSGLREALLFCLRSVRRKVVEQAQWGGTRKSAKYKKRGGDIHENLYPNVLHFSVSADVYPLPNTRARDEGHRWKRGGM